MNGRLMLSKLSFADMNIISLVVIEQCRTKMFQDVPVSTVTETGVGLKIGACAEK